MVRALARFRWEYLPAILALTLFNYICRFFKWQYYLKRLKIDVPWVKSFLIFISGLSMAITPGKVGELLKCYLLKRSTGEPISRTSPIVMSERLTDGIAMLGLSATGLILYRYGIELLLAFLDHPRRVLSRDQLLDLARGRNASPFDRSVDVQVSRLRRKIEPHPAEPRLIQTVRGGGYVFSSAVVEANGGEPCA